ncbi:MAG: PQQ-binding-like beta-propeller repeat protein [bacterium]|nr:PQQ-binding-like beta-propeller repeat protein [bacterium]
MNQKVGLLSIQSKQLWKVLYFDHRGVTVHHNAHAVLDRVVAGFVRTGRLSEDALEEVRDHAARMGQSLTDSLLAGGFLEVAELEERYRFELEEELYELFFCRDARFEFYEGATALEGYDGQTDDRYLFNCDSVVMEAARRIDEWAYITERVPTDGEFFVPVTDSIAIDEYGEDGAAVFELLDGRRSAGRLVDLTGLARFQAFKVLSALLDAGAIAPVADDELLDLGSECLEEERFVEAIHLFERAAALGIGYPEVHSLAANAYRAATHYEEAARHLEAEAEGHVESGDPATAAERLLEVREMLPTALAARERLVELAVEHHLELGEFDALADGKEVVDLLLEFGDIERVRTLLERLLLVVPEDLDLKKALISVHVKAGDQQRVAELYESIAEDLVEAGQPLEAVGYLQKILLMDRSRSDISHRVRELYESDERARKRTRSLGALALLFCVLVVVGAFYWFYNERANQEYATIDVRELLEHDDFAGAAIAYDEFVARYPLTTAIADAKSELRRIDAAREAFEARLATEKAERDRALERLRARYRAAWAKHREQFLGGEPEAAIESLKSVREIVAEAGRPEDVAWALENEVEHNWQRLQKYLAEAETLATRFRDSQAAGDWREARRFALMLADQFENTAAARQVHVPVMVVTQPPGARIMHRGKPLVKRVDGEEQPLVTPTLIYCSDVRTPIEVATELAGFESARLTIRPMHDAEVSVVLTVVPQRTITFPKELQSGIVTRENWIAVGLRGGKIGVARVDGAGQRVLELNGLKEIASNPHIDNGRVFFVSNENTIECLEIGSGSAPRGWPAEIRHGAVTELAVGGGRVAVVDGRFVLHCWEQARGSKVWSVSLDSAPSGPPTLIGRRVLIGTNDGRVLIIDSANGRIVGVLRGQHAITTQILSDGKVLTFGCATGLVRTVDIESGKVLWDAQVGDSMVDGTMVLTKDLVCCGHGKELFCWERLTGVEAAKLELDGVVQSGLAAQGSRLFVRLQREKKKAVPARDVLLAVDLAQFELLWEYEAAGISPGVFGVDNLNVAFPGAAGEVVMFR